MTKLINFIDIALKEVGTVEVPENKTKYGKFTKADGQPWCGSFVMWCAAQAGIKVPNVVLTSLGAELFKGKGAWKSADRNKPKQGWLAFYDFPNDGVDRISHIGIIAEVLDNGLMYVVEGNTTPDNKKGSQRNGGEVAKKLRAWKADNPKKLPVFVIGYGVLKA